VAILGVSGGGAPPLKMSGIGHSSWGYAGYFATGFKWLPFQLI